MTPRTGTLDGGLVAPGTLDHPAGPHAGPRAGGGTTGDGGPDASPFPRRDGVQPGDGVGVQPGKGVRAQTCPRCLRPLARRRTSDARLCDACAAERRSIVRQRWIARWWP